MLPAAAVTAIANGYAEGGDVLPPSAMRGRYGPIHLTEIIFSGSLSDSMDIFDHAYRGHAWVGRTGCQKRNQLFFVLLRPLFERIAADGNLLNAVKDGLWRFVLTSLTKDAA